MNTRLHVGNVSPVVSQAELRSLFSQQGAVLDVNLVSDRSTGHSRGFAFVIMETHEGAQAAVAALNGEMVAGQFITVSESHSKEDDSEFAPRGPSFSPRRSRRKLY